MQTSRHQGVIVAQCLMAQTRTCLRLCRRVDEEDQEETLLLAATGNSIQSFQQATDSEWHLSSTFHIDQSENVQINGFFLLPRTFHIDAVVWADSSVYLVRLDHASGSCMVIGRHALNKWILHVVDCASSRLDWISVRNHLYKNALLFSDRVRSNRWHMRAPDIQSEIADGGRAWPVRIRHMSDATIVLMRATHPR